MTVTREDLVKTLGLDAKDAKTDRAVYGEVMSINEDQTYQVSLNGSDTTVKCARLSGAKVGDTVLVEILANGYSVVTGTVGGDTDASDAQASASAAVTAAGQAQSAAGQASTAASQALTKANEAEASASAASTAAAAAQTAADTADSKATAAGTAAAAAQSSADAAATAAATADSKADAASAAATRAETKADTASAAASRAESSASTASQAASQAVTDAAAAQTAAATADQKATTAGTAAAAAQTSADNAATAAATADSKADAASAAATRAEGKADTASAAADAASTAAASAQTSADGALVGLSTVQDVVGVLNWITAHGTMTSQSGGTFDDNQVYFVQDNNGDYTVGGVRYSLVAEPKAADINSYYVLTVDESVQNYVATHLAVDSEGLWIIPDAGGNKVLIATGNGSSYTTAGTYIIGKVNNVDKVLAKFLTTGATVGQIDGAHSVIDADGQRFYASDGTTQLANIGYGQGASESGTAVAPYYTFGTRKSGSAVGNYSVAEGKDSIATAYCSHAEGSSTAQQYYAHAEGGGTTASADSSHAEGGGTTASGIASHAEGYSKRASGIASHAEGGTTISGGDYSHAEGFNTKATGQAAHAGGNYTIAAKENQTVIGSYNIEDTETTPSKQKAFIIGNGTSGAPRSNAFTVDWSGNTEAAGDITDGSGNVLSDKADTSSLSTVATSGSYSDLSNKPTIPTKTSDLTNDSGFTGYPTAKVTNTGTEVAMSGLYVRRKVAVKDNISVTSGNYVDNSTSVSTTGYTLLGVLGYSLSNATTSGTGGMYGYIGQLYCTGNTVYYRICNRNSSAIKVKIEMDLLYFKS